MKVALIGNGDFFDCSEQLRSYDYIIAADGGANHCARLGIQPDQIIGDGDSITAKIATHASFQADPNQNTTDLQKVMHALQQLDQITQIDLFCFTSHNRLDHTLAAIALLQTDERIDTLYTPWQAVRLIRQHYVLTASVGTHFSLLPVGTTATVDITGAQWSGQQIVLDQEHSGISNSIMQTSVDIVVHSGLVLCLYHTK